MPLPIRVGAHPTDPISADFGGEHRPKSVSPEPDRLVADFDTALMQQVLHIPKRQWEPNVHHYRQADDFGTGFEIPKGGALCHPAKLFRRPARLKPICSDRTSGTVVLRAGVDFPVVA
jgi:hypothetical protein